VTIEKTVWNLSRPFIERPVATTLLTLGVALSGVLGYFGLPVSALPQIDTPTISVSANLPGASPETMASTVAAPLERTLGRIAGVNEITSSSSLGSTRVTLQFDLTRDIDGAARDVQAGINAARALLPTALPSNPTWRKLNPADAPIMVIAMTSDTIPLGELYDVASTVVAQKLSQVSGVGQANPGGGSLPAVRVELDPVALAHEGISPEQVRASIAQTNVDRPKGIVESGDKRWQVLANDQAHTAAEYIPTIVSYSKGAAVRVGDVATVTDSVQDTRNAGLANGKPAILIQILRQPNANTVETVQRVRDVLPQIRASISPAVKLDIMVDATVSIKGSLREVERTLLLAVLLVVLTTWLFLGDWRASLVPVIAVPVSLLATFSVIYLLHFSLNIFSLMALTVATGFVVDDAVVVLENSIRHVENGMPPREAAFRGAREVGFTVVAMSLSLIAVFTPILFMPGLQGRLFREFGVTLSVAVLASLIVSLTTTPMMISQIVKARRHKAGAGKVGGFLSWFDGTRGDYRRTLEWALDHGRIVMLLLAATVALNVYLYIVVPKGFLPQQDTGRLMGGVQGDQSLSFQAMQEKMQRFVAIVKSDPAVANVGAFTGGGQRNGGFVFVALKPVRERGVSADQVIARLRPKLAHEPGASLFLQAAQDVRTGGRQSNSQYQYTLQADSLEELRAWEPKVRAALSVLPEIADVNTDSQDKGLETRATFDRDSLARLGVSFQTVDATLYDWFGQRQVATIYNPLNQYHVVMEAAPRYLESPDALSSVQFQSTTGKQVPLPAIADVKPTTSPLAVNHQGQFPASTISYNLAAGVAMSTASKAIERAFASLGAPPTVQGSFQGSAKLYQAASQNNPWLILGAIVAMYLILGILYESTLHPITILSTLPSAGVGALLALLATRFDFTLIALIGVILLIGIVKKNAIMMIDVAIQLERDEGLDPRSAILEACVRRFRPILMTTVAAAAGALPLAFGQGDGTEMRQPLGVAIVGGLLLSQVLTLYTTPVIYLGLDRWRVRRATARAQSPLSEGA